MDDKKLPLNNERRERLKKSRIYLDMSQEAMGEKLKMKGADIKNRENGTVEIKQIFADALEKNLNISSAWIMTGQGCMIPGVGIGEQQPPYQPSITAPTAPDIITHPHLPPITITEDLLSKTASIIDSQTPFASALKSNIEAFSRGLSLERDLAAYRAMLNQHTTTIEHQNKIIEEQNIRLNTFEERLKSMEEKKAG